MDWSRTPKGQIHLGGGLLILASRFEPHLRAFAQPLLEDLVKTARATAFLSLARGEDCVAVMVAEPEEGLLRSVTGSAAAIR